MDIVLNANSYHHFICLILYTHSDADSQFCLKSMFAVKLLGK